jgi:hypothetical protein
MADDLGRRIAELVREAEENVTEAPARTWYEATIGHPGALTHRPKLPEQRLADLRRDYVLSRLSGEVGPRSEREHEMMRSNPGLYQAMEAYRGNNKELTHLSKDQLQSPHEYTGVFSPGSGLHTAGQWLQSGLGMAASGSHMLANAAGDATALAMGGDTGGYVKSYGDAAKDFGTHFNTLTAPAQAAVGIKGASDHSSWSRADAARRQAAQGEDWKNLTGYSRAMGSAAEHQAAPMPEGEDLLRDYRVEEMIGEPATRFLGVTMDNILNPLPPPLKAIRGMSKAGQHGRAAFELGKEMLPGYATQAYAMSLSPPKEREPDEAEIRRLRDLALGLRGGR